MGKYAIEMAHEFGVGGCVEFCRIIYLRLSGTEAQSIYGASARPLRLDLGALKHILDCRRVQHFDIVLIF